ncbi:MAG: transporter substrate-binding domain-containing protein [Oscillospiraceae bacterium]|nr:transporter substrate-binding domain-containing protein [Oscillospiraceae bacterium]
MKMKRIAALMAAGILSMSATLLAGCKDKGASFRDENGVFDPAGAVIGVQLGTTGDEYARDLEEKPEEGKKASTIERYNKGADAVNALKQGKVDCVIIDNEPAKVFVSLNEDLQIEPNPFADEDYAIAIKKGNTELLEKINGAIKELKEDGTIDKILGNYIGDDTGNYQYTSPEGVSRTNGTLTMGTNAAFPPYEQLENGKIVGIDPDIMQAVCDKLGMELKIEDMEFDSIIPSIQSGKVDVGVAGMTVNEDRLKNVDFSESYAKGVQVIITKK